jgi:hypothetical protein
MGQAAQGAAQNTMNNGGDPTDAANTAAFAAYSVASVYGVDPSITFGVVEAIFTAISCC